MNKPNLLLVAPFEYTSCLEGNLQLPLCHVALANYVIAANVTNKIEILDLNIELLRTKGKYKNSVLSLVKNSTLVKKDWDIIGISTHFKNTMSSISLAKIFKKFYPTSTVILGGIHATACHKEILKQFPFIDIIVLGEGEEALAQLCREPRGRVNCNRSFETSSLMSKILI